MSERDIASLLTPSSGFRDDWSVILDEARAEILRLRALLQSGGDANDNQRMELLSENERLRTELAEARDKALAFYALCVEDFGEDDSDDGPVAAGLDSSSAITFKAMREFRDAMKGSRDD